MASQDWGGVFPALMTEMNADGSLDLEGTARHMEFCLQGGCKRHRCPGNPGRRQFSASR